MTVEEQVRAHADEAGTLYWEDHDLPQALDRLLAGIRLATEADRPDLAKPLCYNVASFCWPGWPDREGGITADQLNLGESYANENLRLAVELKRTDAGMANAHFLVGAYHLTRGRRSEAAESFREYARLSQERPSHAILAEGLVAIASPGGIREDQLATFLAQLEEEKEDGIEFAAQLRHFAAEFGPAT